MNQKRLCLETCVDSVDDAVRVLLLNSECTSPDKDIWHRVELCADLDKEGLSPSIETLESIVSNEQVCAVKLYQGGILPIRIMIRPPPASVLLLQSSNHGELEANDEGFSHFVYSEHELEWMKDMIYRFARFNDQFKHSSAIDSCFEGFVLGCLERTSSNQSSLTNDSEHCHPGLKVHKAHLTELLRTVVRASIEFKCEYRVTFHKAFDMVDNSMEALNTLIEINNELQSEFNLPFTIIDTILTSGAEGARDLTSKVCASDSSGAHYTNINRMVELAQRNNISIMPGGGVRSENTQLILSQCPRIDSLHSSKILTVKGE